MQFKFFQLYICHYLQVRYFLTKCHSFHANKYLANLVFIRGFLPSNRYVTIETDSIRLLEDQMNPSGGFEQTKRNSKSFPSFLLLYTALRCHGGQKSFTQCALAFYHVTASMDILSLF